MKRVLLILLIHLLFVVSSHAYTDDVQCPSVYPLQINDDQEHIYPQEPVCNNMSAIARRVGVLIGSSRHGGNGAGIALWLQNILQRQLNASTGQSFEVVAVDPTSSPHPFGPVVDGARVPAQIADPSDYITPGVAQWSKFVSSCAGFAVVSPEYNGGYPGELKNSIDHLYHEWANKPVLLLTYGGGGGTRAAAQLQTVLSAVNLQPIDEAVNIKLPPTFIAGPDRVVNNTEAFPEFLTEYEPSVTKAVQQLAHKLLTPPVKP